MRKIYFISGHRDITEEEFKKYYEEKIFNAINENASFILGDCDGTDLLAQKYLKTFNVRDVTIYHIGEEPKHNLGFQTKSGFVSYSEADNIMTYNSHDDIAWVRNDKKNSYTQRNIDRRKKFKNDCLQ